MVSHEASKAICARVSISQPAGVVDHSGQLLCLRRNLGYPFGLREAVNKLNKSKAMVR